jgi:hypothetical protein
VRKGGRINDFRDFPAKVVPSTPASGRFAMLNDVRNGGGAVAGRKSVFGKGAWLFSSARSEIYVDQQHLIENEPRRGGIFRSAAR